MFGMSRLRSSVVTASIALCALGATASPTVAGGDEASKSPTAILADLKRDLGKVKSLHFAGRVTESGSVTRLSGDVFASGSASIGIVQGKGSLRMILLSKSTYLKANAVYWKASGGKNGEALASKLAGRWVKVPESVRGTVQSLLSKLSPKHLASCYSSGTGTLSNNGVKTLGGRQTILLEDKGDQPGTAPGLLYVAADGPVLPLRQIQTGPRKAGGKRDKRCDEAHDTTTAADITMSRFDRVPPLKAPRHVLSLENSGTTA
jgi:hypothetical protein